jgi:hypothetical protein
MTNERKNASSFHGSFSLPGDRTVFGELLLKGADTILTLKDAGQIDLGIDRRHIQGISVDNDHITCVDCIHTSDRHRTQAGGTTFYAAMLPHFVVVGRAHLDPDSASVTSISFKTTDLNTLFHDREAFGYVPNAISMMDMVLAEKRKTRSIEVGESPQIHYYTGKATALSVESAIGRLSVGFEVNTRIGGIDGIRVKSRRRFQIKPAEPIGFSEAIDQVGMLRRFLSLAAGRPQKITSMRIVTTCDATQMSPLRVYWTHAPKGSRGNVHEPQSFDLPIDPIDRSDEFMSVLKNWIARDNQMRISRAQLLMGMRKGNWYDTDRLVAAANMFDLLPPDACPRDVPLPSEMADFKKEAMSKLKAKAFPRSDARSRALGDMGRWGKASLTDKVLHRWAMASKDTPSLFEGMNYVLKLAVKSRNYFVHGPGDGFAYDQAAPFLSFFTDALEFVFAFSDFVEAGWNASHWAARNYSNGHMFTRFRWMYPQVVPRLKASMEADVADQRRG